MDLDVQVKLTIGKVTIEPSREGYVWLYWSDGKGMEIEESKLADCLEDFYYENF